MKLTKFCNTNPEKKSICDKLQDLDIIQKFVDNIRSPATDISPNSLTAIQTMFDGFVTQYNNYQILLGAHIDDNEEL